VSPEARRQRTCGRWRNERRSQVELGHANPSITLSFYAHPFDASEHEERAAAVLEAAALGERQRKTAVASAGEPMTAPEQSSVAIHPASATGGD
jgi:hypothetical protein